MLKKAKAKAKAKAKSSLSLALLLMVTLVMGIAGPIPIQKASAESSTYQVTPAPEWDYVFDKTNHGGDGFVWAPIGIKNRQGLGTSSTKSAILFNDSYVSGRFVSGSTMGTYTGVTPNTPLTNWLWGTNGQKQNFNPMWGVEKAESGYSGTVAWNLVSGYGMSGIRGTTDTHDTDYHKMWVSDHNPSADNSYIIFDTYATKNLGNMYIWNFNEPTNTSKGLKNIKIFTSTDGVSYTEYTASGYPFQIPQAGGTGPTGYSKAIDLNSTAARYVKITYNPVANDGNWGNPDMYGLSAVRLYDSSGNKLVLSAQAGSTANRTVYVNNSSWNMAGFTLGNYIYFNLHNRANCCSPFKANATQLMRYTITNGAIDYNSLKAFDALPYTYYPDIPGGFSPQADDAEVGTTYRVKQFENLAFWEDDDGYVYMLGADETFAYGAWSEYSKLLLSRVSKDSFEDFNAREYWDGSAWSRNYETAANLKDALGNDVGPVGNMPSLFKAQGGQLDGKYVLVYMEGVDGNSYFRVADHPWGPWSDKKLLYARAGNEHIYNTGAVPFISKNGEFYFYLIKDESTMKFFKYSEVRNGENPNVALNKTATADSTCSATETAANAVDGSATTKWCSNSGNRWLHIDLGSEQQVNQFIIKHASEGGENASNNTKAYNIQVSNDDTNWTTVVNVGNNTYGVTVDSIADVSARYIKLNVTTPTQTTDTSARIYEFEVYGSNTAVKTLKNIQTPAAITGLTNGTAKTAAALGLPAKVTLVTDVGTLSADVTWDLSGISYNPTTKNEQTFMVPGTVDLLDGMVNPDNIPLKTSISVTVLPMNLALNKAATADSSCSASETAAKAVDGSVTNNSKWCSKSNNRWLQIDLGSMQTVNKFIIKHSAAGGESATYNTKAYNIQVSSDGTNWSTVVNVSNNTNSITTDSIAGVSARYIKLNVSTPTQTTDLAARIYEFEVYGSTDKTLNNITTPAAVTGVANGTVKTAEALGLPSTVELVTDAGSLNASVAWDANASSYDPTLKTAQTFTVNGMVTLPSGVANPNNVTLTTSVSVTVLPAPAVPQATLTGVQQVDSGQTFNLSMGLSNVTQSVYQQVYAQDFTLSYDPASVQFDSVTSLKDGFRVIDQKETPGQLRIVAASVGANVPAQGDLLAIQFKAKSVTQATNTTISVDHVKIANGQGNELQVGGASREVQITVPAIPVDKSLLNATITSAQAKYDAAVEGNGDGLYAIRSKAQLQSAIDAAQAAANNSNATQQQVDSAKVALEAAIQVFESKKITADVNGGGVSIGDLAVVAAAYGKEQGQVGWNEKADVNHDGKVDIEDLAIVAKAILQ